MAKYIKHFNDFSLGVVDRKYLARADSRVRDNALEDGLNMWNTSSGSIVNRPGTKLMHDFGENTLVKCFTFARGQNQQYLLAFTQGRQQIWYIDPDMKLVEAAEDEVEQDLVPHDLASNTDQGFNIVSTAVSTNAYQLFSEGGYGSSDIYTVDITFPNPISLFRINMLNGYAAVMQGTFYKSTGESWTASASNPATTSYRFFSGSGSTSRTYYRNMAANGSQVMFEFPTGENTYDDITRVVLTVKRYESYTSGTPPRNYSTGYRLGNGNMKKLNIVGTTTTGTGAVWNYDIPVDVVAQASHDFTNRYLFLAHRSIQPYVISIFGAFVFNKLEAKFPTSGDDVYNFSTLGYPDVICAGQSRLWLAGFDRDPTAILGSEVGYNLTQLENFVPSITNNVVLPSSAVRFRPTDIRNKINWAIAATNLNFASWDGIFKMTYGNDQPISATGATVIKQNEESSGKVQPTWYNGQMVFSSMGRDEVRLMDMDFWRQRQDSRKISELSDDINSRKIKKLMFRKDPEQNVFVLYEDGTAAQMRIIDNKVAGFMPFSIGEGIQDVLAIKTDQGERLLFVITNNNRTQLVAMDLTNYPTFPQIDAEDLQDSMKQVSTWVYNKCCLDAKVYIENQVNFLPNFEASQIQRTNPAEVDNLIDTYPYWVALKNPPYGETSFDKYVGKRLFFTDETTGWDFYLDIYSMPRTDGVSAKYYAWKPVGESFDGADVLYTTATTGLSQSSTYIKLVDKFYNNNTAKVATSVSDSIISVNSVSGIITGQPGTEYERYPALDEDLGIFVFGVPEDPDDPHWLANIDPDEGAPAYYGWTRDDSSSNTDRPTPIFTLSPTPAYKSVVYDENKQLVSSITPNVNIGGGATGTEYDNCVLSYNEIVNTITITSWNDGWGTISGLNNTVYNRDPSLDVPARGAYVYAVSASSMLVGITEITPRYEAESYYLFNGRVAMGEYAAKDGVITLEEPVAKVVYGLPYEMSAKIGYIMEKPQFARRKISRFAINSYASWGLKIGTESSEDLQQVWYASLMNLPFKNENVKQLVDMYNTNQNIYGYQPTPIPSYITVDINDTWSNYKAIVLEQTIPYPFEIFSIEAAFEENDTTMGG